MGGEEAVGFYAECLCVGGWGGNNCQSSIGETITVNTLTDDSTSGDGLCSLRKAINNANAGSDTTNGDCAFFGGLGPNTINFSLSGTIKLNSTLPTISYPSNPLGLGLRIDGTGQAIQVDGAGQYDVLAVSPGAPIAVNNLTIQNGNSSGSGGGIYNDGTLTVTNSTLSSNSANNGGGIANESILTITNSTFSDNSASVNGGGIFNDTSVVSRK